jgi:hypothetical protein
MEPNGGLTYWKEKAQKRAEGSFGAGAIPRYAMRILERLHEAPGGFVEGCDVQQVADELGVPRKFVMRALASTIGVVTLDAGREGPIRVQLQMDKICKVKASARLSRTPIGMTLRRQLVAADEGTCSHCEKKTAQLEVDHIIPLSLLGADEPGNWVALCKRCNREKWQNLQAGFLKRYRGRPIVGAIGARFRDGRLWPRINLTVQYETREDWGRAR